MKRLYSVNFICLCIFVIYVYLPRFSKNENMKMDILLGFPIGQRLDAYPKA